MAAATSLSSTIYEQKNTKILHSTKPGSNAVVMDSYNRNRILRSTTEADKIVIKYYLSAKNNYNYHLKQLTEKIKKSQGLVNFHTLNAENATKIIHTANRTKRVPDVYARKQSTEIVAYEEKKLENIIKCWMRQKLEVKF